MYFLALRTQNVCLLWPILAVLSPVYAHFGILFYRPIYCGGVPKLTNIRYAMMLMWRMNIGEGGGECRKKSESLRASYQVYPTPQKYVKIDLLGIKDGNNSKT